MKNWLALRLHEHVGDLECVRQRHASAWADNVAVEPRTFIPSMSEVSPTEVDRLRERFPELPEDYFEFITVGEGWRIKGFGTDDDYRFLRCNEVETLTGMDRRFVDDWLRAQEGASMRTPPLGPVASNPHKFDARELMRAIVIAASRRRGEEALLWIPTPRSEFWRVASWEGCRRYANLRSAFDGLLLQVVEGLDAALS